MYEVTEKMYEISIGDGMLVEKTFGKRSKINKIEAKKENYKLE